VALGRPSLNKLAKVYGISALSLGRHKKNHLSPALVTAHKETQLKQSATSSIQQAKNLVDEAMAFLRSAKRSKNIQQGLQAIQQARSTLELYAKLSGELDERPTVTIDLSTTVEWITVRTALMQALIPYPEARLAATAAIGKVA
jgi:hypothetical protein